VGGENREDEKGCRITLPIEVAPGFQLQVLNYDLRGFAEIPLGSVGQIYTGNWFYTSTRQWKLGFDLPKADLIPGPSRGNFTFSQKIDTSQVTTGCGESLNLELRLRWRINTLLGPRRDGMLTLDSLDGAAASSLAGITYGLRVLRCDPSNPNPLPPPPVTPQPPVPNPPTPGPSAERLVTELPCSSGGNAYRECDAGVAISRVTLARQISSTRCRAEKNFGFKNTKVWVDKGCRGTFNVYTTN
jgi:hypothetical protein